VSASKAEGEVVGDALIDAGADDTFAWSMYELDDSFACIQQTFWNCP
jgi:hypothetical protein